jgi:hypothetical protein
MFQNNPVLAAFGASKLLEAHRPSPSDVPQPPPWHSIGWQVYFDPKLVSQWEVNRSREYVRAIVDSMLIAHGPAQGVPSDTVYSQTLHLKPADGGGWFLLYWLDLFAKALLLLLADLEDRDEMDVMSSVTDTNFEQQCADFARLERLSTLDNQEAFATPVDSHTSLRRFYKVCQGMLFSVTMEVLCPMCSPALLAEVIQDLNRRGIHVAGVCSFDWTQVSGVGQLKQSVTVGDALVPAPVPTEIRLIHHVREIEPALAAGRLHARDSVMFNCASLITFRKVASGKSKQRSYAISSDAVASLRQVKSRYNLSLGIFVDEATMDNVAARLVVSTANRYPDVFDLGFAWAGVSCAMTNLTPTLTTAFIGLEGSRAWENVWQHHMLSRLSITLPAAPEMVVVSMDDPRRMAWEEADTAPDGSTMTSAL